MKNSESKPSSKEYRAGFVGLIGQPNSGKSSFLNHLVKEKVSIVTDKPQTTRNRVLGIKTDESKQIVFVDAPGLVKKGQKLNRFLEEELLDVIKTSDVLLAILSLDLESAEAADEILTLAAKSKKPWAVVINKTDLTDKVHRLLILKNKVGEYGVPVFLGTVKEVNGFDVEAIENFLGEHLPKNPGPLYDTEIYTPHSIRELVCEIIREKCFEHLHHEVPYGLAVKVIKFDETTPTPRLNFEIVIEREAHKKMVIGKGGSLIKQIGTEARVDIEKLLGQKVFLELFVRVQEAWQDNKRHLVDLGYDLQKRKQKNK